MSEKRTMTFGVEPVKPQSLSPDPVRSTRSRWSYLVPAAILLTLLVKIPLYPDRINHDCALVLHFAKELSLGALPYVDFVDVNPPLVFYVNLAPVLLANVTGLGLPLAFSLSVFTLLVVSTLATQSLLGNPILAFVPRTRSYILSTVLLFSLYIYASGDFGQREHLFVLVLFPWFWCRLIHYDGGQVKLALAILVGVMLGIGACLKPHFLMIVFSIELVAILEKRNFKALLRPEMLSLVLVGLVYGMHFLFLPAVVKAALFDRWLPFFSRYYQRTDLDLFSYYAHHRYVIPAAVGLALLSVVAFVAIRRRGRRSLVFEMATAAFVASLVSLWVQRKGYSYHLIPVKLSLILLLITLSIWWYEESLRREGIARYVPRQFRGVPAALLALSLFLFTVKELIVPGGYYKWYESFEPFRKAILEYTSETDRVSFYSNVHGAYPPLVQDNRRLGSRFGAVVPSVLMYDDTVHPDSEGKFLYRDRSQMPKEELRILDEMAEDVSLRKPKLIFVFAGDSCVACPKGFNLFSYLKNAGFFDRAMKDYTMVGRINDHAMYLRQDKAKAGLSHD